MEQIIKKAIEGGLFGDIPKSTEWYIEEDFLCLDNGDAHVTVSIHKTLMTKDFWQALGKSCGWYEYCDNPDHGFIEALKGVKSTDIGRLGCPGCGHDEDHIVPSSRKVPITYALHFHQINLERGREKAVKYLEDLLTQKP